MSNIPTPTPAGDIIRMLLELLPAHTDADLRLWRRSRRISIIAGVLGIIAGALAIVHFIEQRFELLRVLFEIFVWQLLGIPGLIKMASLAGFPA